MEQKEELVTSDEMSALLPEVPANEAAKERERRRRVVPYNFRRPDRLSKEQVRSLYLLHDLYAHSLSSSLPLFLRAICEVDLISVEQQSYGDYLRGLSDPTTMFTVSADTLRGIFAVEFSSSIAFPVIDRMLGGEGRELNEPRAASDVELKVLEGFLAVVVESYREVWKTVAEFETKIIARETRPQLLQIVSPNEIVATVVYQLSIGDATGLMSICLPVGMFETVITKSDRSQYPEQDATPPEATNALLKTISITLFDVTAELDRLPAAVADLMALNVGDLIRTNHSIEKPINICIANAPKFEGRIASLDRKLVVQLAEPQGYGLALSTAN